MDLLLDTCALLWCLLDEPALTHRARNVIESAENVYVSSVSAWEISTKFRLGKLPGADDAATRLPALIEAMGFSELPIRVDHGQRAGSLPGIHKDPFDRMLIAQAHTENLAIVSSDKIFDEYHIRRIW